MTMAKVRQKIAIVKLPPHRNAYAYKPEGAYKLVTRIRTIGGTETQEELIWYEVQLNASRHTSRAAGADSSTVARKLSPGMTMAVPSGSVI